MGQTEMYPLAPKWSENSVVPYISCPYCSEPLTKEHMKQTAWNGHVSGDILPYMCFIEDCNSPDDLYRTSEELTEHVISAHGVPCWICDECTPDTEQDQFEIFETAELWRQHWSHAHSETIPDSIFSKFAESKMRKMVPPIKCPLCDYATSEIKTNIAPEILRHIHQFSIRSLPWEARVEGNLSEEHLTRGSSSASDNNSNNDRRPNAISFEDLPDAVHEDLQLTDHGQIQSIVLQTLVELGNTEFNDHVASHKSIPILNTTACELMLPILIQLRCSTREMLHFKHYAKEWQEGQSHESYLNGDLSQNISIMIDQVAVVSNMISVGGKKTFFVKTKCGTDAYIHQWLDLLDQSVVPGDPDYDPRKKHKEVVLALRGKHHSQE